MERVELIIKKLQLLINDKAEVNVMLTFAEMLVVELHDLKTGSDNSVSVLMSRHPDIVSEVAVKESETVPVAVAVEVAEIPQEIVAKKLVEEVQTETPNLDLVFSIPEQEMNIENKVTSEKEDSIIDFKSFIVEELQYEPFEANETTINDLVTDDILLSPVQEDISPRVFASNSVSVEANLSSQVFEPFVEMISKPIVETVAKPIFEFVLEPISESSVEETTPELVSEITSELVLEPIAESISAPVLESPVVKKERFSFFADPIRTPKETKVEVTSTVLEEPKQNYVLDIPDEIAIQMGVQPKPPMNVSPNDFIFDEYAAIPTLELNDNKATNRVPQYIYKEANEVNNQFKEHKVEVAHLLENTHIKDLKKAISINERYLFINDLFKGDEHLFERSLKHIQNFSILPEATFWIERELKIPLQWSSKNEVVQLFDQLVKRRFS